LEAVVVHASPRPATHHNDLEPSAALRKDAKPAACVKQHQPLTHNTAEFVQTTLPGKVLEVQLEEKSAEAIDPRPQKFACCFM
jgi:hypothetical protein